MKKIFLLPILLAAFYTTSYAQANQEQAAHAPTIEDVSKMEVQGIPIIVFVTGQTEQMTKDLSLSDNQKYNVTKVNTIIAMKRRDIERMTDTRQIQDAKVALAKYSREEYQKVFNPEQFAKWEKMNKS